MGKGDVKSASISILGFFLCFCTLCFIAFTILGKISRSIHPNISSIISSTILATIGYASGYINGKKLYWKKDKMFLVDYGRYYLITYRTFSGAPLFFEVYETETHNFVGGFLSCNDAIAFAIKKEGGEMALPETYPVSPETKSPLVASAPYCRHKTV